MNNNNFAPARALPKYIQTSALPGHGFMGLWRRIVLWMMLGRVEEKVHPFVEK
jgi:hypothetical protein